MPKEHGDAKFDEHLDANQLASYWQEFDIDKPPLFVIIIISHGVLWMEETLPEDEAKTDIAGVSEDMGVKTGSVLQGYERKIPHSNSHTRPSFLNFINCSNSVKVNEGKLRKSIKITDLSRGRGSCTGSSTEGEKLSGFLLSIL